LTYAAHDGGSPTDCIPTGRIDGGTNGISHLPLGTYRSMASCNATQFIACAVTFRFRARSHSTACCRLSYHTFGRRSRNSAMYALASPGCPGRAVPSA
jgi:hypothetical protein